MKFYFSLILSAVLLITQTWSLSLHARGVENEAKFFSDKDFRLKMAVEVEKEGERLQTLQDQEGIALAHAAFSQKANENLRTLSGAATSLVGHMSEEEATRQIEMIKPYLVHGGDEKISSILIDRSLSNQEKLILLQKNQSSTSFQEGVNLIKGRASVVGYQKAFKEISDQFRSRYDMGYWGESEDYPMVFLAILILVVVVTVSIYFDVFMYVWGAAMIIGLGGVIYAFSTSDQ